MFHRVAITASFFIPVGLASVTVQAATRFPDFGLNPIVQRRPHQQGMAHAEIPDGN